MNWTARDLKLVGMVVVVIATGALIWSATERGERDDDVQRSRIEHLVPKQTWSTLSVGFHGKLFTVSSDNQKRFDVEDLNRGWQDRALDEVGQRHRVRRSDGITAMKGLKQ